MFREEWAEGERQGPEEALSALFPSRALAIRFINFDAMVERSYRFVCKRKIERDDWRPLMWLVALQAKYAGHPNAGKLNAAVATANNSCDLTADKHVKRAVSVGMISARKVGTEVRYGFTNAQLAKLRVLAGLLETIPKVVELQVQDPSNPAAGSALLPPEVYYNVVSQMA